jgi:hypothetical protein
MFSTPAFRVADDDGQPAQAPRSTSHSTPVSGSITVEQNVTAVLGHRRPHAAVQYVLDLAHDLGGFAGIVGMVRGRLTAQQRLARDEMIHDRGQHARLDLVPGRAGLGAGDADELVAEEDPLDPLDPEQALTQGRDGGFIGVRNSTAPASATRRPGRNFSTRGLGVGSVWMNMALR